MMAGTYLTRSRHIAVRFLLFPGRPDKPDIPLSLQHDLLPLPFGNGRGEILAGMEGGGCRRMLFPLLSLGCLVLLRLGGAEGYRNHTVGDDLGWYDRLEVADVDYQKWASGKNFSLGDFLVFNTDMNHSVVQTYNLTTYTRCSIDDAEDDDTIDWSYGPPKTDEEAPVTIEVPLIKEGANYFFSGYYDGEQCKNGQKFKIGVLHGQGLPPSLRSPSAAEAPAASGGVEDDDSVPATTVPANFDHPKDLGTAQEEESSAGGGSSGGRRILVTAVVLGAFVGAAIS